MHKILPKKENSILRGIAKDIAVPDIKSVRIRGLISDMKKLLSVEKYGVALAAPQVGEPLRLFIISGRALAIGKRTAPDSTSSDKRAMRRGDTSLPDRRSFGAGGREESPRESSEESPQNPRPILSDQVYINPELLKLSRKKSKKHEGCLSIRGKWGIVPRAEKATMRAYDENGVRFTRGASGFLAHIFQHELDHLEGILYTDKAVELYDEKEEHSPTA